MRLDSRSLTLVAITDDLRDGPAGLVARAAAAVRGGATMVQLRLKDADGRTLVDGRSDEGRLVTLDGRRASHGPVSSPFGHRHSC